MMHKIQFPGLWLIGMAPFLLIAQNVDLVEAGWEALAKNDRSTAEMHFKMAAETDAKNNRAHLGLAYLYQFMEKRDIAWKSYKNAIDMAENPEPFIYAGVIAPRMSQVKSLKDAGILKLYENLAETGRHSTMRASAAELAGQYYQDHNQLKKAQLLYATLGAVKDWIVIGPFDNISASGFDRVFPPETEIDTLKTYIGKNDIPVRWFPVKEIRHDQWIDFRRYFSQTQAVFYANTFVYSPKVMTVQVRTGTSGAVKVFLNDKQILDWFDENNNDLDTYIAETEFQQGWNRLLVKCGFSEISQCNFMVRLTNASGGNLEELRISPAVYPYTPNPDAPVRVIRHFAEAYFETLIQQNPDHLENYLLLADCYLRNDKAIEAELVLRKALERSPDNILIMNQLIEAFQRGEKYDEITTTYEKMYTLDPGVPPVLDYKFNQSMDNEDYDKAADYLDQLNNVLTPSPERGQYRIALFHAKGEQEKVIALTREMAEQFPNNWSAVKAGAYLSLYITKNPDQAIKTISQFLKQNTQDDVFNSMMDLYLKDGNFKKWEETAQKRMLYNPAATGYYYDMADTYKSMQYYGEAEALLIKTLAICPGSSLYWGTLADIQRTTGKKTLAIASYEKALSYNPAYYEARDKHRELQGKPPVFDQFGVVDTDSLIKNAPGAETFPDDGAVILYNEAKRVVYAGGASESREELLVRVFNATGIDQFKEYWIGYNPYTEKLIVEKAVVIKSDGSEINADQDDNHIVFKTLESENIIHLKWKIRNYYSGKLSNHFWDQFYFNAFHPIQDIRYSVLVPDGFPFQYKTQFMPEAPGSVSKTLEGTLYQWRLTHEQAIQYEQRMPALNDMGKMLYISSIPDWAFVVDWYTDLAKTKTRSSYEIREKVDELFGGEVVTVKEKIRRIHHFITENIRYSYVPFRQSGLIPQKARDVLVNRIGDCKDMATLAIAMLREAGIDAHYVIVNTRDEGRNRHILPTINFNHAIVKIETGGPLYVDMTAQNYAVGTVPQMDMGAFYLDIKPGVTSPSFLDEKWFIPRELRRTNTARVLDDNSLSMNIRSTRSGNFAAQSRQAYRFMGQKDREKTLIENLNRDYPSLELKFFEIENIDSIAPDITYTYELVVDAYADDTGSFKILKLPWTDALKPDKALSYERRQYPYDYWPATDLEEEILDLTLPQGYVPVELPASVHLDCPIAEYSLSLKLEKGIIRSKRIFINKKWDVAPEEYSEFRDFYNRIIQSDSRQILLKRK